jgi:hypothetical protein
MGDIEGVKQRRHVYGADAALAFSEFAAGANDAVVEQSTPIPRRFLLRGAILT